MLRPRKPRKARNSCGSTNIQVHEDPRSPSSSSNESSDVETPSKPRDHTASFKIRQAHATKTSQAAEERDVRQRQYCTQAYLLRLVRKRALDKSCPNVSTHYVHRTTNRHALDQKTLAQHMQHQLEEDLNNRCKPLRKPSWWRATYRVRLDPGNCTELFHSGNTRTWIRATSLNAESISRLVHPDYTGRFHFSFSLFPFDLHSTQSSLR